MSVEPVMKEGPKPGFGCPLLVAVGLMGNVAAYGVGYLIGKVFL